MDFSMHHFQKLQLAEQATWRLQRKWWLQVEVQMMWRLQVEVQRCWRQTHVFSRHKL
jgi:hypothetical protein